MSLGALPRTPWYYTHAACCTLVALYTRGDRPSVVTYLHSPLRKAHPSITEVRLWPLLIHLPPLLDLPLAQAALIRHNKFKHLNLLTTSGPASQEKIRSFNPLQLSRDMSGWRNLRSRLMSSLFQNSQCLLKGTIYTKRIPQY